MKRTKNDHINGEKGLISGGDDNAVVSVVPTYMHIFIVFSY